MTFAPNWCIIMVVNRTPHIRAVSADGENHHCYSFEERNSTTYDKYAEHVSMMCPGNKTKGEKNEQDSDQSKDHTGFFRG